MTLFFFNYFFDQKFLFSQDLLISTYYLLP